MFALWMYQTRHSWTCRSLGKYKSIMAVLIFAASQNLTWPISSPSLTLSGALSLALPGAILPQPRTQITLKKTPSQTLLGSNWITKISRRLISQATCSFQQIQWNFRFSYKSRKQYAPGGFVLNIFSLRINEVFVAESDLTKNFEFIQNHGPELVISRACKNRLRIQIMFWSEEVGVTSEWVIEFWHPILLLFRFNLHPVNYPYMYIKANWIRFIFWYEYRPFSQ